MATTNDFLGLTTRLNKAWNAKRDDLIYKELRKSRVDINEYIVSLIADGYTFVDAPASGDIDLTTQNNANRKYIVCWKTNNPTGTCNVDLAKTMTDSIGDIRGNGKVIIIGVKLNSYYQLTDSYLDVDIQIDDNEDYQDDLEFRYIDMTLSKNANVNGTKKFSIQYSICGFPTENILWFEDLLIDFSKITLGGNASELDLYLKRDTTWTNNLFELRVGIDGFPAILPDLNGITIKLINCDFSGGNGNLYIHESGGSVSYTLNLENVVFRNHSLWFGDNGETNDGSTIQISNSSLAGGDFSSYKIKQAYPDRQKFLSDDATEWTLDIDGIMTDNNFSKLHITVSPLLQNSRVAGNEYNRRYYSLVFQPDQQFDDDFKTMFAQEQSILVWWRDDLDDIFVNDAGGARKIKNLTLYENDGTTQFDYRNNENFMMIVKDANNVRAVLCWYEGMVFPTVFTDFWDNTEYTIERCFQLLEPPEQMTWRNLLYNQVADSDVTDSPIEGSGQFQEMTSIYVDKRI